jgi:hypothetical protein
LLLRSGVTGSGDGAGRGTGAGAGGRISLQGPHLLLKLLVAVLQLLDRTGQLANLALQLVDLHGQIGVIRLPAGAPCRRRRVVVAEQVVDEIGRAALVLGDSIAGQSHDGNGNSRRLRRASKYSHVRKPKPLPRNFP